ncbi:MAG: hypothetical protein DI535_14095 [Citrobacter freundii]|nr:MAG: hypothetical protein DI535_14095 [Citrobacter freundii]
MKGCFAFTLLLISYISMAQTRLQVVQDTVRVNNAELVIRNGSKDISGFLFNTGNGKTRFIEIGKSLQYTVGSTTVYSQPGDTSYTNVDFVGRSIKVWKNGLFQYRSNVQGIKVDSTIGKIIFKPALQSGDKIYIEALFGVNLIADMTEPTSTFSTNLKLGAGISTSGQNFTLRWATNNKTLTDSPRVVGLGSSTLAGQGLVAPYRLGDKIQAWLNSNTINSYWNNLAVSGYSSINLLPVANNGNASTNIEAALSYNPDFIFISLPSNDATGGLSVNQSLANYRLIDKLAAARGVPVFWGTTQPRNATVDIQQKLKDLADSTRNIWPDRYVESFIDLFDASAGTPAAANPAYLQSDGLHFTTEGNQYVANRLFTRWSAYFQPIEGVQSYVIEKSTDSLNWTTFDNVSDANKVKKVYTRSGNDSLYFRVKANYTNGGTSPYSNVVKLMKGMSVDTAWTNATRVLLEFGGNGTTTGGYVVSSPDNGGKYWNSITGNPGVGFAGGVEKTSLVTTANQVTAMGIKLFNSSYGTFGTPSSTAGINYNGFAVDVQDYPANAVHDNMFVHQYAGDSVYLRLKGLQQGATYRIKIWGARLDTASGTRILEAKIGRGGSWTGAKSFNARYNTSDDPDYDRAIVLDDITGVDSVDINVRAPIAHSVGHISLIDIKIKDYLPVITTGVNYADVSTTLPDSTIQLTGTVSSPGSVSLYAWSQFSGPSNATITNGNTATPTIANLRNGTYVFTLVVTYNNGQQATDNVTVLVYPNNNGLKTMRVHFSNEPATPIPGWVNAAGAITTTPVSKNDTVTGWTVASPNTGAAYWTNFNGVNSQNGLGATTGNNTGVVPDLALANYWFNNNRTYDSTLKRHNVVISGLNASKTYTLKLVGSRALVSGQRWSAFYVNGNITRYLLDVNNNKTNQVVITGLVPDAENKINIGVYMAQTNTAAYGPFSYLNALIIQEEP